MPAAIPAVAAAAASYGTFAALGVTAATATLGQTILASFVGMATSNVLPAKIR